ncbi:MAG: cupin domain-containing protein [Leptolyngbyaceae cyanobacterium SM1_1_3]|nr:cupin domain-containing protein [Leptolyngbyaceae cyanobacterium SM1_1_3]NJN01997.1 cupin domain-containing protein [Leptolyngbyaceae cyanobacterium RM1_1_2]NJO08274.1 cupin domain-containing protein [Leptolyngbyaceae cyanobacterium SL_1_1]
MFPDRIRHLPKYDGPFDAFHLVAQGCQIYFASYPAGTVIEPHHHETDNYGLITQGELILILAGQQQRFGVGQWYHVSAGEQHAARFEQPTAEVEFWFDPIE